MSELLVDVFAGVLIGATAAVGVIGAILICL
jgi:hypothetical protein